MNLTHDIVIGILTGDALAFVAATWLAYRIGKRARQASDRYFRAIIAEAVERGREIGRLKLRIAEMGEEIAKHDAAREHTLAVQRIRDAKRRGRKSP